MKYSILLLVFGLLSTVGERGWCQTPDVSSLEERLPAARGKDRVDILNELADRLGRSDPKAAKNYAKEAYDLSEELNYPRGLIPSAYHLGFSDRLAKRYSRAERYTKTGIAAARAINDPALVLKGLEQLAGIYQVSGLRKELAETKLEYTRLQAELDQEKSAGEKAIIKRDLAANEAALNRSEAEKAQITDVLNQTVEEKLRQEAIAARLAQEKAELEAKTLQLQKDSVQNALKISLQEKELLQYEKELQLRRSQMIISLIGLGAVTFILLLSILLFRVRRLRAKEKLAAQRQLLQQEKMATLGQLTAGIAHEIKNPLNFVNNFAEGSEELTEELTEAIAHNRAHLSPDAYALFTELAGELKQNATDIRSHGNRADRIVRSMMDHARGDTGQPQPVDVNALLRENLHLAYHGFWGRHPDFQVELKETYDTSLKTIQGVPTELSRVFLNIFNNACEALYQKQMKNGEAFSPTLSVTTETRQKQAVIRIRDNGPGISGDIREKIFTPFFTTKPTGEGHTGLGLSISYDIIVQGHEGQLEVETEPGAHTEFIIRLPAA